MAGPRLTLIEATKIKRRLWDGETSEAVAAFYQITPWAIHHIARGMRWKNALWPDGKPGGLSPKRRQLIMETRRSVQKDQLGKRVKMALSEA